MKLRIALFLCSALALGLLLPTASLAADADLQVLVSGPATVVAGTDAVYEITVYNNGPDPATSVTVTDIFPFPAFEGGTPATSCTEEHG